MIQCQSLSITLLKGTGWANTEFGSYAFKSETDDDASVIETAESKDRRRQLEKPLTEDEQRELRPTAEQPWTDSGFTSSQTKL
jgi:hypothetical protein